MNKDIIEVYQTHGIDSIKNIFTADAYVSEDGIASDVTDIVLDSKQGPELWSCVSEMMEKYIKENKKIN